MKRIWKCQNMFSYSVHAKVKLPVWRLKDTNVSWTSLKQLPKEKVFFQNYMTNVVKITWQMLPKLHDKCCQNWKNPWGIVNTPSCDVITKIGTCLFVTCCWSMNHVSRIRKFYKEQKIFTNLFYFYVLKELSSKMFL